MRTTVPIDRPAVAVSIDRPAVAVPSEDSAAIWDVAGTGDHE